MLSKLLPFAFCALTLLPDEGQWLPTQVREMDWKALEARGMKLTRDEFWHPEKGGVLSATVHINGCTASFVSADGLMITNHHCGFDAVSRLSTVQHNYLQDGFAAAEQKGELPAPGVTAFVLQRIENVTAKFHEVQEKASSDLERFSATQALQARLIKEGEAKEPNTVCNVAAFLEGQEYHLYYRTKLTDVRLVYAPPRAIGEFGGEVDNWEWPRHTGDFTLFRAWCGPDGKPRDRLDKDGKPRDRDDENVPFKPEHWLKVAAGGVSEGELAIIMGYPGNTQRYRTSTAVRVRQGFVYPKREELLTAVIKVLEEVSKQDAQYALKLASRIKTLANVEKNARGMVWGLERNAVVERKLREEAEITKWLGTSGKQEEWGKVLPEMHALDEAEAQWVEQETAIGFAVGYLGQAVPLLDVLVEACGALLKAPDRKLPVAAKRRVAIKELGEDVDLLQKPIAAIVLQEVRKLAGEQRLQATALFGNTDEGISTVVDSWFGASKMADAQARVELFNGGLEAVQASEDPLVRLAMTLAKDRDVWQRRAQERQGRQLVVGRRWIALQQSFRGKDFYPDANSTLRVSIATVKGYVPKDGVVNTPHTTVQGILQKETGKEPFASPAALLKAAPDRKQSRFFDKKIGDVPVCFLTDGDTTGGNSGSPVINGKGELIGINFDRVFENVSGDFSWNPERSRNISVDVRFVLWVIESVFPAPGVLKELVGGK